MKEYYFLPFLLAHIQRETCVRFYRYTRMSQWNVRMQAYSSNHVHSYDDAFFRIDSKLLFLCVVNYDSITQFFELFWIFTDNYFSKKLCDDKTRRPRP